MTAKQEPKDEGKKGGLGPTTSAPLAPLPQNTALAELGLTESDLVQMGGGIDGDDISIPRMTVLQPLSPEIAEGLGTQGDFFVKGINLNLGKGPLDIIVLMRSKSRTRWKSMTEGGGILCRSKDAVMGDGAPGGLCSACPQKEWNFPDPKSGKLKPDCDLSENVICVIRNQEDWIPVAFSGSRTRLKALKDLNTLLMFELDKKRPLFSKCYSVRTSQQQMGASKYFVYSISPGNNNQLLGSEEIKRAAAIFNRIKSKKLVIETEPEDQGPSHSGPAM